MKTALFFIPLATHLPAISQITRQDAVVAKGIDTGRISTVGHGPAKPIADNATEDGHMQRRRVEMLVLKH